jgi:hypothetical protein
MKKDTLQLRGEQQLSLPGHVMRIVEGCRIARQVAEWNPQEERRRGRPVRAWKDGTRDSVERRSLKDEEYFDRELWRENNVSLG